jgi:hypothetical protein
LGDYVVLADVRSSTTALNRDAYTFVTFSIVNALNPPASGVTLTSNLASPQVGGTAVTFTAAGLGSTGYRYRFWLSNNNGATWAIVQDWSPTATWTLPGTTAVGTYVVLADVNTNAGTTIRDAYTAVIFQIVASLNPPATGLTLTPTPGSPQQTGTPVAFLAVGQGSTGYEYRFWLSNDNGATWTIVQDWGAIATWTLPGSTLPATYVVLADVRTNPGAPRDLYTALVYSITP